MVPITRALLTFSFLLAICTGALAARSSSRSSGDRVFRKGQVLPVDKNSTLVITSNSSTSARNSVLRVPGDLLKAHDYVPKSGKGKSNKNRGSRGPSPVPVPAPVPVPTLVASSDSNSNDPGKSLNLAKTGQNKQSWLAVASAVAHSAAAETNEPTGSTLSTDDSKPTKYHYYPHNQHLYLLPECATQQVCSAVYLRLNYSQPLCACPNFHEPCSVSTRTDDRHTIPLVTGSNSQVLTLVKTCESTQEVRECRAPKDWSILALQNSRTGKAHYLVICRCPPSGFLEGPIAHSQPAYARVPGIRVYGMTCVRATSRTGRQMNYNSDDSRGDPNFPWHKLKTLLHSSMSLIS